MSARHVRPATPESSAAGTAIPGAGALARELRALTADEPVAISDLFSDNQLAENPVLATRKS
jgi:hypothetical protein